MGFRHHASESEISLALQRERVSLGNVGRIIQLVKILIALGDQLAPLLDQIFSLIASTRTETSHQVDEKAS